MRRHLRMFIASALLLGCFLAASRTGPVDSGWRRWNPSHEAMVAALWGSPFGGAPSSTTPDLGDSGQLLFGTTGKIIASSSQVIIYGGALQQALFSSGHNYFNNSSHFRGDVDNDTGALSLADIVVFTVQAQTIADDGAGTAAAATLTPTKTNVSVTCNDANGCNETLSETGAVDGALVIVTNVSANAVNFADTAGVSETAGAIALGQWDTIVFQYKSDRWVQVGTVGNN